MHDSYSVCTCLGRLRAVQLPHYHSYFVQCIQRKSKHAPPGHCMHFIILHLLNIERTPQAGVFLMNRKEYFYKYYENLVNPFCSEVMPLFYLTKHLSWPYNLYTCTIKVVPSCLTFPKNISISF